MDNEKLTEIKKKVRPLSENRSWRNTADKLAKDHETIERKIYKIGQKRPTHPRSLLEDSIGL